MARARRARRKNSPSVSTASRKLRRGSTRPRPRVGTSRRLRRVASLQRQPRQQPLHRREVRRRAFLEGLAAQQRLGAVARACPPAALHAPALVEAARARGRSRSAAAAAPGPKTAARPARSRAAPRPASPQALEQLLERLPVRGAGSSARCRAPAGPRRGRPGPPASAPSPRRPRRKGSRESPARRSAPANLARWPTRSTAVILPERSRASLLDQRLELRAPDVVQVAAILQEASQGLRDRLDVEMLPVQANERLRPVDRLGGARCLQQPARAERLQEPGDLVGEGRARAGDPRPDDPDLLFEARVLDVEVEAAPPQRVADLPRAVGRQDDVRDVLGARACRAPGSSPGSRRAPRGGTPRSRRRRGPPRPRAGPAGPSRRVIARSSGRSSR